MWDPPTGDHRRVAVPPEFENEERIIWNGAVLCASASDHSHVHGGFCSCPFKVAVVGVTRNHTQVFASIYSSQTGKWSNLVSAAVPFVVYYVGRPGVLVGNVLYWMPLGHGYGIAEFDLDTHTLALVEWPSGAEISKYGRGILLAQNGVLCLAIFSDCSLLQMWERKVCSEGVANWVLRKSDKLQMILGQRCSMAILGYADDINVMSLWIDGSCYFLQLNSLQFIKLWKTNIISCNHPYASIYDSGNCLSIFL